MQLSRDAIQRMIGRTGSGVSVGGGGGEGGGITPNYLAQNYVGILYWNQLFTIHGKQTTTVDGEVTDEQDITLPPNTMPSRTETTEGGVTTVVETTITRIEALFDFNSVGGVSALGYNHGGGGGGGADLNALLDSINSSSIGDIAPTASEVGKCLVYNGNNQWAWATPGGGGGTGTVTSITAGTGLSGGTITQMGTIAISSEYQGYIGHGETAYGWGNHANAGYLTQSSLSGYATQTWVANQGYATQTWVTGRGYITSAALSGYATKTWVNNQGYLTSETYLGTVTSVKMTVPTGFSISGSPITSSGTLALGFANGYSLPTTAKQSNWDTAYSWGNHANAGYMLRTEGMKFEARSGYIAARFVLADGTTYDSTRAALAQGSGYIEWWSTGGYFNHWMGNVIIGQDATDSTHYIQIGGGRIYWDNQSKSLYVVQSDGSTAANFYATGGVSALGISTGGSPSVSALTVGTLNVNNSANVDTLNITNELYINGNNIYMDSGNIEDAYFVGTSVLKVGSSGSNISRIYWNGTYLQVKIGSNTYNFKPV